MVYEVQCGEIKRAGYKNRFGSEVKPLLCEGQVPMQPSLHPGFDIGHCPECHETIYRSKKNHEEKFIPAR